MLRYKALSDPNCCYFCSLKMKPLPKKHKGFRRSVELHHLVEKNEGGTDEAGNLVPCCSTCHSLVHEEEIKIDRWYFSTKGWLLHWWKGNKEYWGKPND
jgi:hypothetical protein